VDSPTRASPGPDELLSRADENSRHAGGREEKPDSQQRVAEELGVAQSQLSDASRHVAAAQRYPERGAPDVSRSEALRL